MLTEVMGQFDCGHFKTTNEWLKQRYGDDGPIDWNLGPKAIDEAKEKDSATVEAHKGVEVDEKLDVEDVTTSVAKAENDEGRNTKSEDAPGKEPASPEPAASSQVTATTDLIRDEELAADLSDIEGV